MPFVVAKLPKTGLGNKLFVWANAYVYAHQNSLPLLVVGWVHISLSSLFFWKKNARIYWGYFTTQIETSLLIQYYFRKLFLNKSICSTSHNKHSNSFPIYEFSQIPHWSDFFKGIRENYDLVYKAFFKMLNPKIYSQFEKLKPPVIAVHIRMGDFRNLKEGEDFKKVGGVRTPLNYFVNIIHNIRKKVNAELPVTLFSDGNEQELKEILALPHVVKAQNSKDILDLLHISKADIIVTSAGSTFSFWSAFFSKAIVLIHPDHFHSYIRPELINNEIYEGPTPLNWDDCPKLLEQNFNTLKIKYNNK